MFDNVVIGVDDYERGRDAVTLAQALMPGEGTVGLVHVEVLQREPSPEADTRPDAERQRFGLERLRRLRDEAQIVGDVSRIRAPTVRRGLHDFAASRGADMMVIGAGSPNPVEKMFLGDEAREVLDDAPCAVAVAPRGYVARAHALRTIGVAYDGSAESEEALAVARTLAAERQAALSAFQAVHAPVYARDIWDVEGELDERIEHARQRMAALGDVEPHAALADDTVDPLREFARSVDLLVLGAHKYREPEHLMPLGRSTAQRLADDPPAPVLVLASSNPGARDITQSE